MSTARPLRLKSQEAARLNSKRAAVDPFVKVWVDTSVSHLDGTFDYLVPEHLSAQVSVGIRISVPFSGRIVEALVLERSNSSEAVNQKFISSVISQEVVAPTALIRLIAEMSKRWVCNPYDIVRAAIPSRVASVDKGLLQDPIHGPISPITSRVPQKMAYLQLQPSEDSIEKLASFVINESKKGSVLVLLAEDREVEALSQILGDKAIVLTSSLNRSQRYSNYLRSLRANQAIIIGTRSSIFMKPVNLQTIIIYRENSQSNYEPRFPGWNVRDVALLRGELENLYLVFVGFSPSLEMANLIESGKVKYLSRRNRVTVKNFPPQNFELLPERIFSPIRNALKSGPVLFLVPKKGYASALMCRKCRNIALCACGGKLTRKSQNSSPECVHCAKSYPVWKCNWCKEDKFFLLGRGAIRHGEEIGKAFPGYTVVNSDAERWVSEISSPKSLVIATSGMAPRYKQGYSAVVLLEGVAFFSYADLRGQERSREALFEAASRVKPGGEVLIAIDPSYPVTAALSTWNPAYMYKRELEELRALQLPPFVRSVTLDLPVKEANLIAEGFRKAILDQRVPGSTHILGPAIRTTETARILITAADADFSKLAEFLKQFMKQRSIAKKNAIQLRVDPYSLS